MPSATHNMQLSQAAPGKYFKFNVDKGRLKSVSLSMITQDLGIGESSATASLVYIQGEIPQTLAFLCEGSMSADAGIGWQGDLPLEPNMAVFVQARSWENAAIRCAIITDQK